jgi:hypothetical protein
MKKETISCILRLKKGRKFNSNWLYAVTLLWDLSAKSYLMIDADYPEKWLVGIVLF